MEFKRDSVRLIIVGNYMPDHQESMNRFAHMLVNNYSQCGLSNELLLPPVFMGLFLKNSKNGISKWVGYLDKYFVMPIYLILYRCRHILSSNQYYHIADHSNAPYLFFLPKKRTIITCHDVLAIRGALGYKEAMCEASAFGKILQKWILFSLLKAKNIASVSSYTLNQLLELSNNYGRTPQNWAVIHNSLNADFYQLSLNKVYDIFKKNNLCLDTGYLLHVGSSLPRKNRSLLIKMLISLGNSYNGKVVFAGVKLDKGLIDLISVNNLFNRVVSIEKPSHILLQALYSGCDAFIFPSYSEGFGWPIIEAQACGAPVLSSEFGPMQEVGGDGAFYADPHDPASFANAFNSLNQDLEKEKVVKNGFINIKRFNNDQMIRSYIDMFEF